MVIFLVVPKDVVVQPVDPGTVHVLPVNPFVHMQAQAPLSMNEVPPFLQAVAGSPAHFCSGVTFAMLALVGLSITRNLRGTTIAAAIIISRIIETRMNPQQGKPQHFLSFLPSAIDFGSFASYSGQADAGRGASRAGVSRPGGGNADNIPERVEPCLP